MNEDREDVTVVIPTIGRPELAGAITSVLDQTSPARVKVVVVADLAADSDAAVVIRRDLLPDDERVEVTFTGGRVGAARARNVGIDHADTGWVAFLDDDDRWCADKLSAQFSLARQGATVISTRVRQVDAWGSKISDLVPEMLIQPDQRVANYLFEKRRFGARRASLFTSTLLVASDLARDVRWDESLTRHQDWDWLLRLERDDRCVFGHASSESTIIVVGSQSSISARSDWRSSLTWATEAFRGEDPRALADFLAAQTLRYALQARSIRGVWSVISAIGASKRIPAISCWLIGAAGIVGRARFERGMRLIK